MFHSCQCILLHTSSLGYCLNHRQCGGRKFGIQRSCCVFADVAVQTATTHLLGLGFGILAAVLICLVVAGSLLGNSFVASRMAVAAAKLDWLPPFFAVIGHFGRKPSSTRNSSHSEMDSSISDAPRNALVLSTIISALYILMGNFRALVTFNGLGEYSFFLLTVIGALFLRYREPDLPRPYQTIIAVPVIFALVSGFVVIRGAIFAPVQAIVLGAVWATGIAYYLVRKKIARSREA